MKLSRAEVPSIVARSSIVGVLLVFAVIAVTCQVVVPRNGWSKKWGPMVPHTTFPGDCSTCHVPRRWDVLREDFEFDHEKETGHALEGSHASAACLRCHNDRGPVSAYVARGCGGCHPDPHKAMLGTRCQRCHHQGNWEPSGLVAEHARTRFPLAGLHAVTPCESCHLQASVGDFRDAPIQCDLCHRDELARATSPDHRASGWTRSCESCHSPLGWERATFDHTSFPLLGGHDGLACSRCHGGGSFSSLSKRCFSCHQDDYARGPGHVAQSYSRDCTLCHSTVTWSGAVFSHRFPLTGSHDTSCTSCHPGGNTNSFTCLTCHEHGQSLMDAAHQTVGGYSYTSQACYRCHPDGRR